jgi:hypothetical protein
VARVGEPAGMTKTVRFHPRCAATLHGMHSKNTTKHQAPAAEPETAQERIARVQAAAAVQIARAAAGQPTGWTVIRDVMPWLLGKIDRLLELAS